MRYTRGFLEFEYLDEYWAVHIEPQIVIWEGVGYDWEYIIYWEDDTCLANYESNEPPSFELCERLIKDCAERYPDRKNLSISQQVKKSII